MLDMENRDVVIIGAGPAGLTAALYAQIDGWSTLVLEGRWTGGHGAIAYSVINYPGFSPGDGALLMENMERQVSLTPPSGVGAEMRHEKVLDIKAEDKVVVTDKNEYKAQAIIVATGSIMKSLGVPGEESFTGKGVSYYAKRDVEHFVGKRVLVVGGGNAAAKSALVAKTVTSDVTLMHRKSSLRTYPIMTKKLQKKGVNIWYNREMKEIKGRDHVERAVIINNKTAEEKEIEIDWIVICVGTEPNIRLAQEAGLEIDKGTFVKIDSKMMTSKMGIFACGEITGCKRHLITSASQGASAGMAASEYLAMEKVKRGEMFEGAKNGKYAEEYIDLLG
jgi:thioredoxin reductase (NADPH)